MINKVTLIGNTGRDSEVRTLENGTQVCSFSLATTESYKDKNDQWQDQTEWHNVVVWRPSQNVASLPKGAKVYVEGKISYRKYKDKDGNDRTTTDIVASTVRRLDTVKNTSVSNVDTSNVKMETSNVDSSVNIDPNDDLPF
jgi:single-strand DNA-binding protein